jgi:hypothetical protein
LQGRQSARSEWAKPVLTSEGLSYAVAEATYLHGEMRRVVRWNVPLAASELALDALFDFGMGISSGAACGKVGVFCKNTV